jgi:uncharacterized DUF497 family protein
MNQSGWPILAKHELDFADLDEAFFASSVIVPGKRGRLIAVGRNAAGDLLVVFARLGSEAISVISMRFASRKERQLINE